MLLNLPYLGDRAEHIPFNFPGFIQTPELEGVYNLLFPKNSSRAYKLFLAHNYLRIIQAAGIEEILTKKDIRISYDLDNETKYFKTDTDYIFDFNKTFDLVKLYSEATIKMFDYHPERSDIKYENLWLHHDNKVYRLAGFIVSYVLRCEGLQFALYGDYRATTSTTTTSTARPDWTLVDENCEFEVHVTTTSSTTTQAPHNVLIPRLQWSWPTNDLDAHLQTPEIPNGSGNIWHVHWEGSGYTAQAPYANLNIDNRTGPGDEKIAIINPTTYSGIYRYYVHNYTTVGTVINATGAFVRLYSNNTPGSPFTLTSLVPLPAGPGVTEGSFVIVCTGNGDYWHVFNLNPALISPSNPWGIEIINTVSDTPPGYTISGEGISNPGPIL